MAAVLNAQLTAMLTALDGAAAGLGNEFVAHVGSTMAMAAAMPADWFPKTGTLENYFTRSPHTYLDVIHIAIVCG